MYNPFFIHIGFIPNIIMWLLTHCFSIAHFESTFYKFSNNNYNLIPLSVTALTIKRQQLFMKNVTETIFVTSLITTQR